MDLLSFSFDRWLFQRLSIFKLLIGALSKILGSILRRSLGLSWLKSPKPNTPSRCLSHLSANFGSISLKILTSSGLFCSIAKLSASRSFLDHSRNLNWLSLTKSKAGLDRSSNLPIWVVVVRFSYSFCIAGMSWALDMSHHRYRWEQGMVQ